MSIKFSDTEVTSDSSKGCVGERRGQKPTWNGLKSERAVRKQTWEPYFLKVCVASFSKLLYSGKEGSASQSKLDSFI